MFSKMPTWGWFVTFWVFTFLIWNPTGFSLVTLFQEHGFLNPFVWILGFILLLVPGLAMWQGVRELSLFGKALFIGFIALFLWCVAQFVMLSTLIESAVWWFHLVIAAFLTLSLQFAKWRRQISGTSTVDDADEAPSST